MKSKLIKTIAKHNLKMFAVYENDTDHNTKLYLVPGSTVRFTSAMLQQNFPKFDNSVEAMTFIKEVA